MLESWITPIAIVLAFLLLLLAPLAEALLSRTRRLRYACPWADREVSVEVAEPGAYGILERPAVRSCSAFEDPQHPTCAKGCLKVLAPHP